MQRAAPDKAQRRKGRAQGTEAEWQGGGRAEARRRRTILGVHLDGRVAGVVVAEDAHEDDEEEAGQEDDENDRVEDGEPVDLRWAARTHARRPRVVGGRACVSPMHRPKRRHSSKDAHLELALEERVLQELLQTVVIVQPAQRPASPHMPEGQGARERDGVKSEGRAGCAGSGTYDGFSFQTTL